MGSAEVPTENMQAYHAYLRAKKTLDDGALIRSEWDVARSLLKQALKLDPQFVEAWSHLARVEAGNCHFNWDRTAQRLAAAKSAAKQVHELAPDSFSDYIAAGYVAYWGEKNFDVAATALESALVLRPAESETTVMLGYIARRQGRYDLALALFRKVLRTSPASYRTSYSIGETYICLREYDRAVLALDEAIVIDAAAPGGYISKAVALANAGRLTESMEAFRSVPTSDGSSDEKLFRLLLSRLEFDEARELIADADDYIPMQFNDSSRLLNEALLLHFEKGREAAKEAYASAVRSLEAEVEKHPDQANPLSLLAKALAGVGKSEEAIAAARRALTLHPVNRDLWVRSGREWDLVQVYLLCGNTEEAEQLLRRLCEDDTDAISRELLRAAKLYQRDSPVPEFAVVADFDL